MAVEKVYKCDLCGEFVQHHDLKVIRVGLLEDRPEDAERLDIGPECHSRLIGELVAKYAELRHG
jgi:hypothetical protein